MGGICCLIYQNRTRVECKGNMIFFDDTGVFIRIVPEWNVKKHNDRNFNLEVEHQNRTRVECKGDRLQCVVGIGNIRIVPEWNVKARLSYSTARALYIRIVPEWNVKLQHSQVNGHTF